MELFIEKDLGEGHKARNLVLTKAKRYSINLECYDVVSRNSTLGTYFNEFFGRLYVKLERRKI